MTITARQHVATPYHHIVTYERDETLQIKIQIVMYNVKFYVLYKYNCIISYDIFLYYNLMQSNVTDYNV